MRIIRALAGAAAGAALGDVGQGSREEIDLAPASDGAASRLPGGNWGWPCFEGTLTNPAVAPCQAPGAREPAYELDHDARQVAAITGGGGGVRDGGLPTLAGRLPRAIWLPLWLSLRRPARSLSVSARQLSRLASVWFG